jgi:hypothetical protein
VQAGSKVCLCCQEGDIVHPLIADELAKDIQRDRLERAARSHLVHEARHSRRARPEVDGRVTGRKLSRLLLGLATGHR